MLNIVIVIYALFGVGAALSSSTVDMTSAAVWMFAGTLLTWIEMVVEDEWENM